MYQSPLAITVSTPLGGVGTMSVRVPGNFTGFPPVDATSARFLIYMDVLADNPANGDYVDGLQLTDDDGVIPPQVRAAFPAYPQIVNFSNDAGVSGGKGGYYLDGSGKVRIGTIDGMPQLIPSGLYLKANITAGGLNLGRVFRVNIVWGRSPTSG